MKPHANQPLLRTGADDRTARAAMIMIHGRNAGPTNILDLVPVLKRPEFVYVAPSAASGTHCHTPAASSRRQCRAGNQRRSMRALRTLEPFGSSTVE